MASRKMKLEGDVSARLTGAERGPSLPHQPLALVHGTLLDRSLRILLSQSYSFVVTISSTEIHAPPHRPQYGKGNTIRPRPYITMGDLNGFHLLVSVDGMLPHRFGLLDVVGLRSWHEFSDESWSCRAKGSSRGIILLM